MSLTISRRNQSLCYTLILISFFMFGEQIRRGIVPAASLNLLFAVALFLLLYVNRQNLQRIDCCILTLAILQASIVNYVNGCTFNTTVRCAVVIFLPLFLFTINYDGINFDVNAIVIKCIRIWNFAIVVMFSIYVIDIPLNGIIMKTLAENVLYSVSNWMPESFSFLTSRYPSYMGHFLYTGELYLIFFVLNICYSMKTGKHLINTKLLYVIYIIGSLSTGSRICMAIMVFMILVTAFWGKNKALKVIFAMGGLAALYSLGLFDFIISRFIGGGTILVAETHGSI